MSASEALRALRGLPSYEIGYEVQRALPALIEVVEAVERIDSTHDCPPEIYDWAGAALANLTRVLTEDA